MRTLSNLWTMLAARDSTKLETVAFINNVEYAAITAPEVHHSLLSSDALTVGNCVAASMTFMVMTTDTIPASAKVVLKSRLVDGSVYTNWYEFGTFWVSKRTVDDDMVTLECYDAMLKGNQPFGGSEDAMNWPKSMKTVVDTIASRMGVSLDSRTSINANSDVYKCEYPGEMTLLEVLGYIGACHGGNWIITPENKLRLVPLTGSGNTVNVPVVLSAITTARSYTITGITMVLDEEHVFEAGNDSGYVLTINPCPYANQAIADNLFSMLNRLTYQPFVISGAMYDPAAELGDTFVVGDIRSVVYTESRTYDIDFMADAQAPGKDEMEDEYPYPSQLLKLQNSVVELARNDERLSSRITQTQTAITAEVTRATGAEETLAGRLTITESSVSAEVTRATGAEEALASRLTIAETSVTTEVTRATGAEEALASRLTVAEGKISSTVSRGDVESIIEQKADSIRLKANKISWSSTYSSMTEDGHLECTGASIKGSLKTEIENRSWMEITDAEIHGGYQSSNMHGRIGFTSVVDNWHYGVWLEGQDYIGLYAPGIFVNNGSTYGTGFTGTIDCGNGSQIVFINGIAV